MNKIRLAIIASHPIQYVAPLYQRISRREDLEIKVFYTCHDGHTAVVDHGFREAFAWDIALTNGYQYEAVRNISREPGTHRFWGVRNPDLVERVTAWRPDAIKITGWAFASHLAAMYSFHLREIPILFRGDSHLLDREPSRLRQMVKKALLTTVYRWPSAFLVTGQANRAYYKEFAVEDSKLFNCPHSIDVARFAAPDEELERAALEWRNSLGVARDALTVLYAGKLEPKKKPLDFMCAVRAINNPKVVAIIVGGGILQGEVAQLAAKAPETFRLLPFQNQSRMPIVYRMGDLFVLPSAYNETWGLAVNEALACGRPVLVSSAVGCAVDAVDASCGTVFDACEPKALEGALSKLCREPKSLMRMRTAARERATSFDIHVTEEAIMTCLRSIVRQ